MRSLSFLDTITPFFNICYVAVQKVPNPSDPICEERFRLWARPRIPRLRNFITIN